jgi:lipopolysaccharide/colanic/teichoic acid biosynthesis glycosyltransferase
MTVAFKKRIFDIVVTLASSVAWLPANVLAAVAILLFDGWPIYYVSKRRIGARSARVMKFRTMRRNADRVLNRDTVPVSNNVRFLNTPPDSPLYTPVGRIVERLSLTETPQVLLVLAGRMSLVGNRPLPANVIAMLAERYTNVGARFATPAGMTGPVQLVGRSELSDYERLNLEANYCRLARDAYRWRLDFAILLYTVLIALRLKRPLRPSQVNQLMLRLSMPDRVVSEHPAIVLDREQAD